MAQKYDRRRYGYTDGSLAYDLDALARERALEEAGRVEEDRREPAAAPRRHVRLTEVTADITQLKREMSQQEERHVALLTQYEKTFDLATVKRVAEEEGMKKPIGGQVEYLELPASDSAVVYRSDAGTALESIASAISDAAKTVVEYFR